MINTACESNDFEIFNNTGDSEKYSFKWNKQAVSCVNPKET